MDAPEHCPVCDMSWRPGSWERLAEHLVERADVSDDHHVMWLNRNVTKHRTEARDLVALLRAALAGDGSTGERVRR